MNGTVKERLIQYLKYKHIGYNRFERSAGLSIGYIANLKSTPGAEKLVKILTAAPDINRTWLLTGEGTMLNTAPEESDAVPFTPERHVRVSVVSAYAYAGYLTGYGDPEYISQLPTVDFTPDREMQGNYLAFEVHGDSMDDGSKDSYVDGELVICREVRPDLWRDCKLHINKRDFVIVHADGILIKRITDHNVDAHTITIHSLNPEYPDRTISLADVRQIFSIIESRMQRRRR